MYLFVKTPTGGNQMQFLGHYLMPPLCFSVSPRLESFFAGPAVANCFMYVTPDCVFICLYHVDVMFAGSQPSHALRDQATEGGMWINICFLCLMCAFPRVVSMRD